MPYNQNKIFWLQPEESKLGQWQRTLHQESKSHSFCVLPWIHLATRPNGDMRLCCVANASGAGDGNYVVGLVKKEDGKVANFSKDLPKESFNNNFMKSVRTTMLEGKVPSSCKKCFDEESNGIVSKRIWETGTWLKEDVDIPSLIKNTSEDGTVPYKLQYLDLRLGHTCNLKCIMCSPHDSSKWVGDHKKLIPMVKSSLIQKQMSWDEKLFDNKWHENPNFWNQLYEQIPNLKHLYFAGGEPLIIKEHKLFLEEILNQGNAKNISLRYNSNALQIDEDLINIWKQFKFVKFSASIDAIGQRAHYIRYPTDWTLVENNLKRLDSAADNIFPTVALAAQILNIKHIPDVIKWKVQSNFKKVNLEKNVAGQLTGGGLISVHLVWIPTWLNLRVLPKEDKKEVRELFADLKKWLWENFTKDDEFWIHNPYGWKRWEGLLDWMDSEDQSYQLADFKEYIKNLDQIRGTDSKAIFPDIAHLF